MPCFGGKSLDGVFQTIINLMPPHRVYIEPFLGGGAILRLKRPAALNIGIDRDPEAVETVARAGIAGSGEALFQFHTGDALPFLRSYRFTGNELVYCDPPYLLRTRSSERTRYKYELADKQHRALLDILTQLPCMAMISGYWSQLYADRLTGWHTSQYQAMTRGGKQATEFLWCNFPPPVALHDYRFLGVTFRERERIKRKKQRWTTRLHNMRPHERHALLAAIGEAWRIPSPEITMPPVASPVLTLRTPSPEMTIPADIAGNGEAELAS